MVSPVDRMYCGRCRDLREFVGGGKYVSRCAVCGTSRPKRWHDRWPGPRVAQAEGKQ